MTLIIARYKPGKEMVLTDTLSRAYVPNSEPDESYMEDEVEYSVLHRIPVSTDKLEKIREETSKDPTMMVLLTLIRRGWPQSRQQTPIEIHEFWNYRDEMSEIEGVIMKGDRIVIQTVLRSEMLARVHDSHMGIEKCRRRERDIIFWSFSKCDICQEHQSSNPKETIIESPLTSRPWETVATDLFHWEQKDYLLVVDYYSRYVEVAKLDDTKRRTVVNHTKSIFARHGIPSVVRSDNGPQYTAQEYKKFSKEWLFERQTSSPYYPKSNGLAEKAVQTVKRLLTKAKVDAKDPYLSLLEYRNTPIDDVGSPSQLLMSRRLQSILQTTTSQLQPQIVNPKVVEVKLRKKQEHQKRYYDIGSRDLPPLKEGERIRVQVRDRWKEATVDTELLTPRSYNVRTPNEQEFRRNRVHIRK
jgi:transposase InsO family protein